jgi:hypothetical protein
MLIPEGCDIPVRHLKAMMQIAEAAERTDREFIHRVQEILIAYAKEQQAVRERRVENIS